MTKTTRVVLLVICAILVAWGGLLLFASQPQGLTKLGDVNVDGKVDCADLKIVRNALGTKNGDFGFAPGADINRDGVVDQKDLDIVLSHLPKGMQCP